MRTTATRVPRALLWVAWSVLLPATSCAPQIPLPPPEDPAEAQSAPDAGVDPAALPALPIDDGGGNAARPDAGAPLGDGGGGGTGSWGQPGGAAGTGEPEPAGPEPAATHPQRLR